MGGANMPPPGNNRVNDANKSENAEDFPQNINLLPTRIFSLMSKTSFTARVAQINVNFLISYIRQYLARKGCMLTIILAKTF